MSNGIRRALVCGAGGFIGSHLVKRLKREGFWVRGVISSSPNSDRHMQTNLFKPICAIRLFVVRLLNGLMTSTSLPPIWAELRMSLLANTMPKLCTDRR